MPLFLEGTLEALQLALEIIFSWWWVILPIVFVFILWDAWLNYIRTKFIIDLNWILLKITIPQEVKKTPLAMEQVFAGLHSILYKGSWAKRYIGGRVQEWFGLEIVSIGGNIYFYIYTVDKFKGLVESQIYAQYPDAEIHEVEDYVWKVPQNIPNDNYNLIGSEFVLNKEDAYPIRVWSDFEFETKEGEGNVDPLAGLIEALSKLKEGEQFWFQIGIKPVGDDWHKEGEKVVSKLIGREVKDEKKRSYLMDVLSKEIGDYVSGGLRAPFEQPTFEPLGGIKKDKKDKPPSLIQFLSPGEREVIEAVEKNISKVGFETSIRGIYLAKKDVYNIQQFFSIVGTLRQFSTQNLNSLKWDGKTLTFAAKWPFKKYKTRFREKWLVYKYRFRYKPRKSFIFNIEELATVFHFPGRIVTSPTIPRIEVKKGEPPAGLPTF